MALVTMRVKRALSVSLYPPFPYDCSVFFILYITVLTICFVDGHEQQLRSSKNNLDLKSCPYPRLFHASLSESGAYRSTAIASDSDICPEIGKRIILDKNGSAVDGAIATQVCDGIMNMFSSGIGGGSFMLIYVRKTRKAYGMNFREEAPLDATPLMFKGSHKSSTLGGLSIAVPGDVAGYYLAWKRFGRVPWSALFETSIKMCEMGFEIPKALDRALKKEKSTIQKYPELRDLLIDPISASPFPYGHCIKDPKLARTLRRISKSPTDFYSGELSRKIVAEVQDAGGILRDLDLKNYRALETEVVRTELPNSKFIILGLPPPSSGNVLAFMLRILDGFNFNSRTKDNLESYSLFYHRVLESFKFAYAKRGGLGDGMNESSDVLRNLTSQAFADHVRGLISDDRTHNLSYYGPAFPIKEDHGTSHLSLISPEGDVVSWTTSINTLFGSKVRGPETGIIYNDSMDDFSTPNSSNAYGLPPSPANYIKPGKRPMSSMTPTVILHRNGSVALVVGAAGGSRITSSIAYVTARHLLLGESISEAIDAPRVHHQFIPNVAKFEKKIPSQIIEKLKEKGHKMAPMGISIVQGISVENNVLYAKSDPRKGGRTAGV